VECDNWESHNRSLSRIKKRGKLSYVGAKPLNLKRRRSAGKVMAESEHRGNSGWKSGEAVSHCIAVDIFDDVGGSFNSCSPL